MPVTGLERRVEISLGVTAASGVSRVAAAVQRGKVDGTTVQQFLRQGVDSAGQEESSCASFNWDWM